MHLVSTLKKAPELSRFRKARSLILKFRKSRLGGMGVTGLTSNSGRTMVKDLLLQLVFLFYTL